MATFTQHIPGYCWDSRDPYPTVEYYDTESLLNSSIVQRYNASYTDEIFYRFSLSDDVLMVERNNGEKWWVVGYCSDTSILNLPKWVPNRKD